MSLSGSQPTGDMSFESGGKGVREVEVLMEKEGREQFSPFISAINCF